MPIQAACGLHMSADRFYPVKELHFQQPFAFLSRTNGFREGVIHEEIHVKILIKISHT